MATVSSIKSRDFTAIDLLQIITIKGKHSFFFLHYDQKMKIYFKFSAENCALIFKEITNPNFKFHNIAEMSSSQ